MSIIAQARPSVALATLDLCQSARNAGWRHAQAIVPGELFCGVAMLHLAAQPIPVRAVLNTGEDLAPLLDQLHQDVVRAFYAEQFIVMAGFTPAQITSYQARFAQCRGRRVTVGSPQDYSVWVKTRLGPVGRLSVDGPLRRLTEHMLCASATPRPTQKCAVGYKNNGSNMEVEKKFGGLATQAVETLLTFTRGRAAVVNVEKDRSYQDKDIDLLVRESGLGDQVIRVEVKNERHTTGNISLERYYNFDQLLDGWLVFSQADIILSCIWPTGDLILGDLNQYREWVATNITELERTHKKGGAPNQGYKSKIYLGKIERLLTEVQDTVHLRLGTWMPELYRDTFQTASKISAYQLQKTLHPQRLA